MVTGLGEPAGDQASSKPVSSRSLDVKPPRRLLSHPQHPPPWPLTPHPFCDFFQQPHISNCWSQAGATPAPCTPASSLRLALCASKIGPVTLQQHVAGAARAPVGPVATTGEGQSGRPPAPQNGLHTVSWETRAFL